MTGEAIVGVTLRYEVKVKCAFDGFRNIGYLWVVKLSKLAAF